MSNLRLKAISVKNFKLLRKETHFSLAPITVLTGTNSSGKSSVVQLLKILHKISRKTPNFRTHGILDLMRKDDHNFLLKMFVDLDHTIIDDRLGNFSKIVSKGSEKDGIVLGFDFFHSILGYLKMEVIYEVFGGLDYGRVKSFTISFGPDEVVVIELKRSGREFLGRIDFAKLWSLYRDVLAVTKKKLDLLDRASSHAKEKFNNDINAIEENIVQFGEWFDQLKVLDAEVERVSPISLTIGSPEDNSFSEEFSGFVPFNRFGDRINWRWAEDLDQYEDIVFDYWKASGDEGLKIPDNLFDIGPEEVANASAINRIINERVFEIIKSEWCRMEGYNCINNSLSVNSVERYVDNPVSFLLNQRIGDLIQGNSINKIVTGDGRFYRFLWDNFMTAEVVDEFEFHMGYFAKTITPTKTGKDFLDLVRQCVSTIPIDLIKSFENTRFLSSVRTQIQRVQSFHDGSDLGNIVYDLLAKNTLENQAAKSFLTKYLRVFRIAEDIELRKDQEGSQYKIYLIKDGEPSLLADEGYGVSQILPIILTLAYLGVQQASLFEKNTMLIVEEPEANLHPALQSKLADLFFEAYQLFGIKIVLETHSEYFIRRLQVLTVSNESALQHNDVQIYYFYHPKDQPEGERQVLAINILEDGALSRAFGHGFFDESSNLNVAMYRYSLESKN